jgi:hypothetical protein
MKKLIEALPFLLLVSLTPYFFYNEPNLSQSFILIGIAALCGYRYYCMEQVKPDYVELFNEEFESYQERVNTAIISLDKEIRAVKDGYAKSSMEKTQKRSMDKFQF